VKQAGHPWAPLVFCAVVQFQTVVVRSQRSRETVARRRFRRTRAGAKSCQVRTVGGRQGVSPRPSPKSESPCSLRGRPCAGRANLRLGRRVAQTENRVIGNSKRRRRGGRRQNMSGVSGRITKRLPMIGRLRFVGVGAVRLAMVAFVSASAQQVGVEQELTTSILPVYTPPTCVPGCRLSTSPARRGSTPGSSSSASTASRQAGAVGSTALALL
jgi:hypothetical protein